MSTPSPSASEYPTTVLPDSGPVPEQAAPVTEAPATPSYLPEPPRPVQPTTLAYMNTYALIAILLAFVQPIAGIVFGHLGLGQIKRNGDAGRGIALTALIIGYVMVAGVILAVISYFAFFFIMFATMGAAFSDFDPSGFDDSF